MLVGRDRERAALDRLLDEARASRSGVLVLRGEPGIGKSALVGYARERAEGMRVLSGAAVEGEMELPFAGLHQLVWPVLDRAEALPGVQGAALRGAFGLTGERVADRFLVSVALLGLLTAVAEDGPLLCVVDDAHWLDRPSADALAFAARRLHADPIALVIASRLEEGGRRLDGLPELPLTGLAPDDAAALLDESLPATLRHQLVSVTHGNPLALMELPRALSDDQRAGRAPLLGEVPLTAEIEDAFLAQIRPLPEPTQRLLVLAAADEGAELGAVLSAAERLGLPRDALDHAERAGLIDTHGERLHLPPPAGPLGGLPRRHVGRAPRRARGTGRRARRRPASVAPGGGRDGARRGGRRRAGAHRRSRAHARRPGGGGAGARACGRAGSHAPRRAAAGRRRRGRHGRPHAARHEPALARRPGARGPAQPRAGRAHPRRAGDRLRPSRARRTPRSWRRLRPSPRSIAGPPSTCSASRSRPPR